jgi:hypothetical protein
VLRIYATKCRLDPTTSGRGGDPGNTSQGNTQFELAA